jgi:Methyltransferase domain
MKNPWLDIPLAEYEGHMVLPHVGQAHLLSDVFAEALREYSPQSAVILGCAGGNGLDRVNVGQTGRIVCVDINPEYITHVRGRFADRIPSFEAIVGDVQTDRFSFAPVELAFAGLLFEYVDVDSVLRKTASMLLLNGVLLTVVQLPSATIPEVTPSPFVSLQRLAPVMRLVSPELLTQFAVKNGYREIATRTVQAAGGKEFRVQAYRLVNKTR